MERLIKTIRNLDIPTEEIKLLERDAFIFGVIFIKEGKRIDPRLVYLDKDEIEQ